MKRIRSLLVFLFVLVSALAVFTACGGGQDDPGKDDPNKNDPEKVAPTKVFISNLSSDDGEGTLSDPYIVTITNNATSTHNLTVQPSGADAEFEWKVGTAESDAFTESSSAALTVTQAEKKLTIASKEDTGDFIVQGSAKTGDLTVYIKVTVNEYVALESFTLNGFEKAEVEGGGYDYYFKTAKGTTWNLTDGEAARKDNMGKDPNLTPDNLTYYPNLYQFSFLPVPSNASDTAWIMTAEDESIFSTNADGNWTADKAGETIVTVTNTAEEASIKIKVEVVDTVYPGILKADYDAAEAATDFDWDFDAYTTDENKATDAERMFARLGQWNVVMNKTTSNPDGDDHNQKIFYLGDPDRPYGIDLECHIDANTGVNAGSSIAMIWTKAALPAGVQSIQMKVGNNNKDFTQFRAVMVKEDGTVYSLTDGWQTMGADGAGTVYSFRIPDDCKGSTVAIAVEASLTKAGENAEIMVKGVWIELPIQSVAFVAAQKTVSQGSTVDLAVTVTPTKVIDDSMDYAVTKSPEGGEGKLTVDEKGKVTIAKDAPVGDYVVTVTSRANADVKATCTLSVSDYKPVTAFEAQYKGLDGAFHDLDGAQLSVKQGADALELQFTFAPADASTQTYQVTYSNNNIVNLDAENNLLSFIVPGDVTVTVTPDAAEAADQAVTFSVTVNEAHPLSWANKDKLLEAWTVEGNWDQGVGEGVSLHGTGRMSIDVDLSDRDTLTVNVRTFVRPNEANGHMYVGVVLANGEVVRVKASNYEYEDGADTIEIVNDPNTPVGNKFDSPVAFYFDLSAVIEEHGEDIVGIVIGNDSGNHCVITSVSLI